MLGAKSAGAILAIEVWGMPEMGAATTGEAVALGRLHVTVMVAAPS